MGIACVAGVQRGGRGEVECEREARSLGARMERPTSAQRVPNDRASRSRRASSLAFNFPPPSPLYAGHAGYNGENESSKNSSSKTNIPKGRKTERGKKEKESANEGETDYRHSLVAAINGHG